MLKNQRQLPRLMRNLVLNIGEVTVSPLTIRSDKVLLRERPFVLNIPSANGERPLRLNDNRRRHSRAG